MGAGASLPKRERLVHENPVSGATFTPNEDSTELQFEGDRTPWRNNCIYLEDPVKLSNGFSLTLKIKGAGIIRFGFTTENPQNVRDFSKFTVVSHEDGFEEEDEEEKDSVRTFLVDAFSFVIYQDENKGKDKILTGLDDGTKTWLYIVLIQGRPRVSIVKKDKKTHKLKTFQPSNITIGNNEAIPGRTSSSGVCRAEKPLTVDQTYCINWQMKLGEKNEDYCSSQKYGFFRLGVVTDVPRDLNELSIYSDSAHDETVWFTESAISSQYYNETISFTISKTKRKLTHNLVLSSAKETVTEELLFDCTKQLYLVLEIFHGDICSIQMYPPDKAPKQQYPGHTLLFRNFKPNKAMTERIQIGSKLKTEPYRIQYGTDPTLVLAEFRKKFHQSTIKQLSELKSVPWGSVEEVKESSKIQVLDVPDDTGQEDLENYFSNKSACGGEKIRGISKIEDIRGCWLIKYKHREDARAVWQEGQHRLETSMLTVLPYYDRLGPTAQHGLKPKFDTTDLEVVIDDEKKMNYISTIDKRRFEEHMGTMNIGVIWPTEEQKEFVDDDDELDDDDDENRRCRIVLRCEIPLNQYQQLVSWKDNAQKTIKDFLAEIQTWKTTIDKKVWADVVGLLNKEKQSKEFVFAENENSRTVEVITSNRYLMAELKSKIQSLKPPEDHTSKELEVHVLKYKTLDEAGLLYHMESSNPGTSSTLDTKNKRLILKGPDSEVNRMLQGILELLNKIETVSIKQNKERLKILKERNVKQLLKKELERRKLTKNFEIRDSFCEICVFLESPNSLKQKEKALQESIDSVVTEDTFTIPDSLVESLTRLEDVDVALKEIEQRNQNKVILSLSGKKITCTGTADSVRSAKGEIFQLLKGTAVDQSIAFFQRNIINYMDVYRQTFDCRGCTFIRNKAGMLTGEIYIEGKAHEIQQRKQSLKKETEKIMTFWFHLGRPWLANVIKNLDTLETVADDHRCLLQPVSGDALAESGVSVVALSSDGTAVQVINCDMTVQDTDVIVNAANSELEMRGGLAKAISDAGTSVQDECDLHVKNNGQLAEGDAVFTSAGNLNCREILHVVGPVWKGGNSNEKDKLQTGVLNILNMVAGRKYLSVMIPALSCGVFGYPNDQATKDIVEAVSLFVSQNPSTTVKEIYLCDSREELVTQFENAVKNRLQKGWFVFEHKRPIKRYSPKTTDKKEKSVYLRPKSARPGQRDDILGQSLRWGRNRRNPSPAPSRRSTSSDSSDGEAASDRTYRSQQNVTLPDGLPMSIDLTSRTKLNIKTGTIETQQQDVIVCTTPHFPDLVGAVAKALVRKGGDSILADCKTKGELKFGHVISTDKGALGCKQLFHVRTLMDWSDSSGPDNVRNIVEPCLGQADQMGFKSLAFPAIGTGASHYPAAEVAEIMVKTLLKYRESNPYSGLEDVTIVIYEKDAVTAQTFANVVPKLLAPSENIPDTKETKYPEKKSENSKAQGKSTAVQTKKVRSLRVKYVEPVKAEAHSIADDVVLIQVTTAGTSLGKIKHDAEKLLDMEFLTREIDFKSLTDEHVLTEEEIKRLKQLNTLKVKVDIEKKVTKVVISGLRAEVMKVENAAYNLLKTDFPQRRKQTKIEALINEYVQWQVSDSKSSDGYKNVSLTVNFELEMNFERGKDFTYSNEGVEFQVLVLSYEEYPLHQPNMKRKLYRRVRASKDAGITIPELWDIRGTGDDYKEVDIPANDPLFTKVKKQFTDAGCKPNAINKIIRIENRTLYLQYEVLKKKFQIRNPNGIQNETELWHGSDSATIPLICQKGFNRSYAGKHATAYGEGVYFAKTSSYSNAYAPVDGNGVQRMILCQVLTGQFKLGKSGMKSPNDKNDQVVYNTLVDNANNPSIFVIFHDTQAYPQYVIEYN